MKPDTRRSSAVDSEIDDAFQYACAEYEGAVRQLYVQLAARVGYGYTLVEEDNTASLEHLRQCAARKHFPVWSGGSDNTVFRLRSSNYMFRFIHDHEHLRTGMGFSFREEVELGYLWCGLFSHPLARLIAYAETIGQAVYHRDFGESPKDQRAFARQVFGRLCQR